MNIEIVNHSPSQVGISEATERIEEGRKFIATPTRSHSYGEIHKERQQEIHELRREAFQLANYYFVFQGVIFTAIYNTPSNLKCRYRWIPFTLSLLAGFLNLCALTTIAFKHKRTLDKIDQRGDDVVATSESENEYNIGGSITVKYVSGCRMFYVIGCLGLFIGFYVVTLIGCLIITCRENSSSVKAP